MEQRRINWPAWLALGISILALIVAFGSLAMSRTTAWTVWTMPGWSNQQVIPQGPPGMRGRIDQGQVLPHGWHNQRGWMNPGMGFQRGPGMMGGRDWFGGLIRFVDGLLKLAALALLVWLGFQIFRQRRNQPPATNPPAGPSPQPPLTPAGHDPRVE